MIRVAHPPVIPTITYSVIELLESDVIPEVMPRGGSGRTTCSGRALE